ncbi:homeobox protein Hox-A3a-like [Pristis pectinata]|uniref:homeobox protein Hox-A3a-like n=1 Tax=Pristis pectinata TaxID=685728 RepID=UPI00223CC750|nr:homeobox protein Hox-A3a-like [Pristis pectinata]
MEQRFLQFQSQMESGPRREDCCFPQGDGNTGDRELCPFPPHHSAAEQRRVPEEHVESEAWRADLTLLNPVGAPAVEYWSELSQKHTSCESVKAEVDQIENGGATSCCLVDETPHFLLSEADSQDGLGSLNARGNPWLDPVKEGSSNVQSVSKKYKGRTTFTAEQLRVLQQRFQLQRYVSASERQDLGNALGLSSQQVKTWFQNRRMKVKRILKEPVDGPAVTFLPTDLSQNNPVVFRNPPDYMKQQFRSYLLPRQLMPAPTQQWPAPESVCPALGNFQSTVIKSALQYTNQSVNFSIKKEAIALSSRPETELGNCSVSSCSSTGPVEHFSLQQVFSRPGHALQAVSRPGHALQAVSRPGHALQAVSRPGLSQQGVSRPEFRQKAHSFVYERYKPAENQAEYEKVIIS